MRAADTNRKEPYDVVLVGGGPVGLFAAFYASMREMQCLVLDTLEEPGGQLTALYPEKYVYDVPGFPRILARDLAENLRQQADTEWVEWCLGRKVDVLQQVGDLWRIGESNGHQFLTRTVVITAGVGSFTPNKIGLPGEDQYVGKGVYYFARNFTEFDGQDVVVAGGGDSAVDWSLSLVDRAKSLTLIHRRADFRAHEASMNTLRKSAVHVLAPAQIHALKGNNQLQSLIVEDDHGSRELPCQRLILSLGFKADSGPITGWGLIMEKNKILINNLCETNLQGIFAAGDIAVNPEVGNLKLMVVGFGQAALAISRARTHMDPKSTMFGGHSSAMAEKLDRNG